MRFTKATAGAVLSAASSVVAREMAVDEARAAELYDSGVLHEKIMKTKMVRSRLPPRLVSTPSI